MACERCRISHDTSSTVWLVWKIRTHQKSRKKACNLEVYMERSVLAHRENFCWIIENLWTNLWIEYVFGALRTMRLDKEIYKHRRNEKNVSQCKDFNLRVCCLVFQNFSWEKNYVQFSETVTFPTFLPQWVSNEQSAELKNLHFFGSKFNLLQLISFVPCTLFRVFVSNRKRWETVRSVTVFLEKRSKNSEKSINSVYFLQI